MSKPKAYPEGRICSKPGCGRKLSRWNPGKRCYSHDAPSPDYNKDLETRIVCSSPLPSAGMVQVRRTEEGW